MTNHPYQSRGMQNANVVEGGAVGAERQEMPLAQLSRMCRVISKLPQVN